MGVGSCEPSENPGYAVVAVIEVMVMAVIVIVMLVTSFGHGSSLVADSRLCTLRGVRNRLVLAVPVGESCQPRHPSGAGPTRSLSAHRENVEHPCRVVPGLIADQLVATWLQR